MLHTSQSFKNYKTQGSLVATSVSSAQAEEPSDCDIQWATGRQDKHHYKQEHLKSIPGETGCCC